MEDKLVALNRFFRERKMTTQNIAEKVGMSATQILNLLSGRSKYLSVKKDERKDVSID